MNFINTNQNISPQDKTALFERGKVFIEQKNWDMAIVDLKMVREFEEATRLLGAAYYGKGLDEISNKKYNDSIASLREATYFCPTNVKIWYHLGFSYLKLNKTEQADKTFEIALTYDPNDAPSLAGRGRIAQMQKDWPASIQYFKSAYENDKGDPYRDLLIEAYKLCPKSIKTLLMLAKNATEPTKALKYYDEILELDGDNLFALRGKGALLLKENRLTECVPLLEKAQQLAPFENENKAKLKLTYKLLAKASRNANELRQACVYYTLSLKLYPDDQTVMFKRGKTHYELGAFSDAMEDLNSSLELEKDSPKTLAYLGATLLKVKCFAAGIKVLNIANTLRPDDSFTVDQLKVAHRSLLKDLRNMF